MEVLVLLRNPNDMFKDRRWCGLWAYAGNRTLHSTSVHAVTIIG